MIGEEESRFLKRLLFLLNITPHPGNKTSYFPFGWQKACKRKIRRFCFGKDKPIAKAMVRKKDCSNLAPLKNAI